MLKGPHRNLDIFMDRVRFRVSAGVGAGVAVRLVLKNLDPEVFRTATRALEHAVLPCIIAVFTVPQACFRCAFGVL